jgi:hypothetical protein
MKQDLFDFILFSKWPDGKTSETVLFSKLRSRFDPSLTHNEGIEAHLSLSHCLISNARITF